MNAIDHLIGELRREADSTRLAIGRIPSDKLSWKPHPRSMSLGQLALHAANVPGGIARLLDQPISEDPIVPLPEPTSLEEIYEALERSLDEAEKSLRAWGESGLREAWKLVNKGEPVLEAPRIDMARTFMFNHVYHHRGQMTVYLRLLDIPVPGLYGPSADEG